MLNRILLKIKKFNLDNDVLERLERYAELIAEWNKAASLVSQKDAQEGLGEHIHDSLCLLQFLHSPSDKPAHLLDIGSGAGFPAVPLKLAAPWLSVSLVERSQRKAAFLCKVKGSLDLMDFDVICGDFPSAASHLKPDYITARAVEKPWKTYESILEYMLPGCLYLHQLSVDTIDLGEGFHVEPILGDKFVSLPRGNLRIIRRLPKN